MAVYPKRLKRLESSDILPIKDANGDFLVVTKQETANVIRDFIYSELENHIDDVNNKFKTISENIGNKEKKQLTIAVNDKFTEIEKSIDAYIQYKFDELAEKVCDLLITRKFNEEVQKKVEERLLKKQMGNKF